MNLSNPMSGPAMAGPTTEDAVPQEQSSDPELNDALTAIIAQRNVQTVFQPVIRIGSGEVVAFESLTRPPPGSPFRSPIHLFGAAIRHSVITDLELLCCELAIERFSELRLPGELLLNLSPRTVVEAQMGQYRTLDFLQHSGLDASQVVVEMTEYQRTPALGHLREALLLFRSFGMDVAIDDLGQGFSSLRLWSELRPDLVKIDMHFVQGIHADPVKLQFLRSVQQIADSCGARLIAEGIEETADLLVLRDLGISFGQGFLIAHPQASPSRESTQDILRSICSRGISVFPQDSLLPNSRKVTAEKLLIRATPVLPECTNDELLDRFDAAPDLHAMPVVGSDGRPVGLVNRNAFLARFARLYRRELFGKRSCTMFMDAKPLVIDKTSSIHEVSQMLLDVDHRYLAEGFIVADSGSYVGLATGQDLIREITAMQLEVARYANPLTLLPGNVPIDEHIDRLLESKVPFVAAYCDLNHFKAYNDAYGYSRGDMMIKLTARALSAACSPRVDFLGHIGGDDFILLFQSEDWERRIRHALSLFADEARFLYDDADVKRGFLQGEDRAGNPLRFPLASLAIGIVHADPGSYGSHQQVSAAASEAKKQAKRMGGNAIFVERRFPRPLALDAADPAAQAQ